MEQKKLDFERPLLSARRFTSGAAIENGSKWKVKDSVRSVRRRPPVYKSELKSGPVSTPGTVPFEWEQIPGRPKDDESRLALCAVGSSEVPKLPPGRTSRVGQQNFDKPSVNPVVHEDVKVSVRRDLCNVQSSDENVERSRSSSDGKEGTGNEDEEFVDALETLSRAESLLINCSLSDLIGLEEQGGKVSPGSLIDSQTRDFMMGRFLPAAKAMAAESPQSAPRKPPTHHQQLRQQHKMVNKDARPQLRYGPDFAVECLQRNEDGDEESEADFNEEVHFHGKVCCLLPSLGFRSSFGLLNPLPGMSMCSSAPMPPGRKSQTMASWSCSEADRKVPSVGLETSKHQANRKALETNDCPSLSKVDLPSFRELMAKENQSNLGIRSPVAEKTVYVDTEENVRSPRVRTCASDANGQRELQAKKQGIGIEKRNQPRLLNSTLADTEKLKLMENGAKSEPKFQIPDFHKASFRGDTNQKTRISMQEPSGREQDILRDSRMPVEEPTKKLMRPKEAWKSNDPKIYSELPIPPALPKSPSDSWLGRTLPSISTKNTSVHSHQGTWVSPNYQAYKPNSSDPKWETMVRMTTMQDKHLRFSEDRLTTIPEL